MKSIQVPDDIAQQLETLAQTTGQSTTSLLRDLLVRSVVAPGSGAAGPLPLSTEWMEGLFEAAHEALVVTDFRGRILRVNRAFCALVHYSPEQLVGRNYLSFVRGDEVEDIKQIARQVYDPKASVIRTEIRLLRQDGESVWLEWTVFPIREQRLSYAMARDITPLKELISQLEVTQAHLRAMIDATSDHIALMTLDGTIQAANRAFAGFYDADPVDLLGTSAYDLVHPDQRDFFDRLARRAFETRTSQIETLDDGQRIYDVAFMPIFGRDGRIRHMTMHLHDVTDLRKALMAAEHSRMKFQKLLADANEGILIADQDGRIEMVNSRAVQMLGRPESALINHAMDDVLPHLFNDDTADDDEGLRLKQPDGTSLPVEISLSVVEVEGETLTMCFIIDISEREQLEQHRLSNTALSLELEKEREINDLRNRLITLISHEFRTPLTIISANCQIIDRYYERLTRENILERIEGMQRQIDFLAQMLNNVVELAHVEAEHKQRLLRPIDVVAVSKELIETIILSQPEMDRIDLVIRPGIPQHISLDRRHMEHILLNLVSNALKFSAPPARVTVRLAYEADELVIEVQDEGIGIPSDEKDYVFQPFFRASNAVDIRGVGLGLAAVYSEVQAHQGRISLVPTEQGTHWVVRLPVA